MKNRSQSERVESGEWTEVDDVKKKEMIGRKPWRKEEHVNREHVDA